jgi:hypothetical protein
MSDRKPNRKVTICPIRIRWEPAGGADSNKIIIVMFFYLMSPNRDTVMQSIPIPVWAPMFKIRKCKSPQAELMITIGLVELIMRSVRRNGWIMKPFYALKESRHGRKTERYV